LILVYKEDGAQILRPRKNVLYTPLSMSHRFCWMNYVTTVKSEL